MDLRFKNRRLEKRCNDFTKLVQKYGQNNAKWITRRLNQLSAMPNLAVARKLPQLRCHELEGDRKGQLAVDVRQPFRLVFEVDQDPVPKKEDGGLDWTKVEAIKIIAIEDYHGKRKKK
ncbi:MAG: type II toxin-antitoxin system RelE/ParE family toxin [Desulfobacteraceae bacterium]